MNRQRVLVLVLATALVLAGLAYWIVPHIETYEHEVTENISEKVRQNPFLAMERFLTRLGYSVETSRRTEVLDTHPGNRDTVVMEFSMELLTEERTQSLIEWLERGGHLVLDVPAYGWEEDGVPENELLERLDLRVAEQAAEGSDEDADEAEADADADVDPKKNTRLLHAGGQTFTVDSWFGGDWVEDGSGTAEAWRVEGVPAVLRYRLGSGRVTLIRDRDIWNNYRIGNHDHAALLAAVLGAPRGKVWVLYNVKVDNLLEIIWRHAAAAVSALALTLALALWSLYNRFGPLTVTEHRRRRSLGEHVQAMANFAWRHGRAGTLLAAARAELRHRAEVRHPGFQYRTPADQYAWLAERLHVPSESVQHALETKTSRADEMIEAVALLQKLRNSL